MTLPWSDDQPPLPGVYLGIPYADYRRAAGVNVSALKTFEWCPWKAKFGPPREETDAMALGTLLHAMFLEPDTVSDRYWVANVKRGTNAWRAEETRAMGREMLTQADWTEAVEIFDAVHAQPITKRLLGGPYDTEVCFWWIDDDTGLLCKGRADIVRRDIGILVDLKKCQDASERGFRKSMENYAYDYQSVYYLDGYAAASGVRPDDFIFLAFEEAPPHMANGWRHDLEQQEQARWQVRKLLNQWAECEDSGHWPGYSDFESDITLSKWRYKE